MKLLLVDGSNLVMRCAFGGDVPPVPSVKTATNMIERVAREHAATHLVVALDCPGVPNWRKQLYPDYKANRTRDTSDWLTEANAQWCQRGWWVEAVPGYEADDILATVALRAKARAEVVVVSGDSDVLPLLADGVQILKPLNGGKFEAMGREGVCTRYGISRLAQLTDLKALTGETGDNVPGVAGIGPVRAAQLLAAHQDLDGVIAAGLANACKHSAKVAAVADTVRLARRLVTLATDVPVVPIQPSGCALPPDARP